MATWSSRRKTTIGLSILIIILAVAVSVYLLVFYKAPTCFDAIQNGDETGVDCGGSCRRLCQSAFLPAKISWGGGKFEKVSEGYYNVAAYIENPNTNGAALNVPYKFTLYDNKGIYITERKGRTVIPAQRSILVFEPAVSVLKRIPAKVTFEFLQPPVWFKAHDRLQSLAIGTKKYSEDTNSSTLQVTLMNKGLTPINNILVGAVLYDLDGNAIGFSQTRLDGLGANSQDVAPFTWPFSRNGKVVTVEALPVIVPVRD